MIGQDLYKTARRRIPGGTQLLSKRPEMFLPEQWPSYYSRAKGAEIWDLDDRKYVDMSYCAVGACVLGYADPEVNEAVHAAADAGSMTTLNCSEEVELAELLCRLHPWADMVRFGRAGGEAMAIAVRIARARTGRDKVAFCGYHGWHDWYLAANLQSAEALNSHLLAGLEPLGVPQALAGTAIPFHYNQPDELSRIMKANSGEIAAIVMEPIRSFEPEPGFLEFVRETATRAGALLIFDEVTSGWRLNTGGTHLLYGVTPDIVVFAKCLGNGYPMAAIVGTGDAMQAVQGSFVSSAFWTERIGPAAALAMIRKHEGQRVPLRLIALGNRIKAGWLAAADRAGFKLSINGISPLARFALDVPNVKVIRTLFTQMMLDRGFLANDAFYAMFAHEDQQISDYLAAVSEVFLLLAKAVEENNAEQLLRGPVAHSGFYRLS